MIPAQKTGRGCNAFHARSDFMQMEDRLHIFIRAIEQTADTILITNREGVIDYVNPAFEEMTGYTSDEAIGETPRFLKSGRHPPDFYQELWETILTGHPFRAEFINRKKNGEEYYEAKTITPIRDKEGRITHIISTGKDVTAWKHLEEQLRQSQKMEAIGRLAGGVAHDFNNLLTVIIGFCDHILQGVDAGELEWAVKQVMEAGERGASLTRQLLAFSRRQILQPKKVNLNTVIEEMAPMLRRLIGEHISIATRLPPDIGDIHADPGQLEQVILNLAVNAGEAMPSGGELEIETGTVFLDRHAAGLVDLPPGRYVRLSIRDTGHGMDASTRVHLFEPFFTTKEDGTGLGLATVYGIVKQSGGQIRVDSMPGQGTTFTIDLPYMEDASTQPAPTLILSDPPIHGGTETILLVEDEEGVRSLALQILRQEGYTVLEASNAGEALMLYEQHEGPIHLLVTDVVLPRMSGRVLKDRLVRIHPHLKALYMSGYAYDVLVRQGMMDIDAPLLQKPFTPDTLTRMVRAMLDAP